MRRKREKISPEKKAIRLPKVYATSMHGGISRAPSLVHANEITPQSLVLCVDLRVLLDDIYSNM